MEREIKVDWSEERKTRGGGAVNGGGFKPKNEALKGTTKRMFLGNLSYDITDDKIKEFFKDCGELTDIYWLTDRETQQFKGAGFITFDSIEAADKAAEKSGEGCMGRDIKVDWTEERKPRGKPGGGNRVPRAKNTELKGKTKRLFVGNVSFDIDDEKVTEFFKDCGELQDIFWVNDRESGKFKGFGFITFDSSENADKAMEKTGKELLGRDVNLDWSEERR